MSRPIDACEVLENRLRLYAPDFDADRIQPAAAEQFDVAVQYFQSLEIPPELQQLWSWCGHNRCTVPTRLSDGNRIGGTKFEKLAPALDFFPIAIVVSRAKRVNESDRSTSYPSRGLKLTACWRRSNLRRQRVGSGSTTSKTAKHIYSWPQSLSLLSSS